MADPSNRRPPRGRGRQVAKPVRVLVVEDHEIVAEGITLALQRSGATEVAGVARSVAQAIALVGECDPDVALMDFHLPDGSGKDIAARFHQDGRRAAIVMLSGDGSDGALLAAVEAGACGYLLKTIGGPAIVDAVVHAARGEILFPQETLARLFTLRRQAQERRERTPALTPREQQVLELIATGLDSDSIARRLDLRLNTVRSHAQTLLEKFDAHSKLEAVARAHELGLIQR